MLKNRVELFFLSAAMLISSNVYAQSTTEVCYNPNLVKDTSKKSINAMAAHVVDGDSIKIAYHSPGVRNRIIWGGLVPYGEVWVTGAHDATYIEMPKDFVIAGKTIKAGKYAEKEDIVRIKVKPKKVDHTERLQYFIEMENNVSGKISVSWEKRRVELPFTFKK